jgi:predicted GH43/DUF377 family glycosyl hydrolase
MSEVGLAKRAGVIVQADPDRVMARIFIPGQEELIRGPSRARDVLVRLLAIPEAAVQATLQDVLDQFADRHRDLGDHLEQHFAALEYQVEGHHDLTPERRKLIGAYFTLEYAFESTALFNPSIVPHFDQSRVPAGKLRIIMSLRAVGEGHISSLVFRTGLLSSDGHLEMDPVSPFATTRSRRHTVLKRGFVQQVAIDRGIDSDDLQLVLGMLPDSFTPEDIDVTLAQLYSIHPREHPDGVDLTAVLHEIAQSSYEVAFDHELPLDELVLWPTSMDERRGMEDARFVRFIESDGTHTYRASYTGFNGVAVRTRILETHDFHVFSSMELTGDATANKGLAFFPRRVGGELLALARWDRESNSLATSEDGYHWHEKAQLQLPTQLWELVHLGNCGSPIETDEGWIVLTHGVGPMRRYCIGAMLLDLEDPSIVRASLPEPLLAPTEEERNGYVPNVVYSCGALAHKGTLVIPYGISDARTGLATVSITELMEAFKDHRVARAMSR